MAIASSAVTALRDFYEAKRKAEDSRIRMKLLIEGDQCTAFGIKLTEDLAREWAEVYPSVPQRWLDYWDATNSYASSLLPDRISDTHAE